MAQLRCLFADAQKALQRDSTEVDKDSSEDLRSITASQLLARHHRTVCDIRENYEPIEEDLRQLSTKVAHVSSPAVRVGERLEALEAHRSRALEIHDVVRNFDALNNPASTSAAAVKKGSLDAVFTDPSRSYELLKILKLLVPVAAELDSPQTERGKKCVESYVKQVETKLIREFQDARDGKGKDDKRTLQERTEDMKKIADALTEFNGGTSVVQTFLQMPHFFVHPEEFTGGPLEDPDTTMDPLPEESSKDYFNHLDKPLELSKLESYLQIICHQLKNEYKIIVIVFQNPGEIMGQLIRKSMELNVRPFFDALLMNPRIGPLDYARVLHAACTMSNNILREELSPIVEFVGGMTFHSFLDNFFESYLIPRKNDASYLQKESYMNAEMRGCTKSFDVLLEDFKRNITAYAEVEAANAAFFAQLKHKKNTVELAPLSSLLSVDIAQKLISINSLSIKRCCDVSKLSDLFVSTHVYTSLLLFDNHVSLL